ncbi:MAG: transmembrane 220 family protein [Myxococcota bacterium]
MVYRLANGAWCSLLLYAVAVQYNDPDPVRWMFLYGVGAAICAFAAVRGEVPLRPVVAWGAIGLALAAADLAFGVGQTNPMGGFPYWGILVDEIVREALGLTLMSGWMLALAGWTWRRRQAA